MIYCVTQLPERYVEVLPDGKNYGLYTVYGHNPLMFNLITRIVTATFMYEPGFESIPLGKRIGRLHKDQCLEDSLNQTIGGIELRNLLQTTNPLVMFQIFANNDIEPLELINLYGDKNLLLDAMQLRVLQFRRHYRGKLISNDNIVKAHFKSDLTVHEDRALDSAIESLKGVYASSGGY